MNSIIPSSQILDPAITKTQEKMEPKLADNLIHTLKAALTRDDLFTYHKMTSPYAMALPELGPNPMYLRSKGL